MSVDYQAFLSTKRREWRGQGLPASAIRLPESLFHFQAALTRWALRKGRAGIFSTTGTGKSRMSAAWSAEVVRHTGGRVLMIAPLCVEPQTITEGQAIGVEIARHGSGAPIEIVNYERLHHVTPSHYVGVVADEASRLKAFTSVTRNRVIAMFQDTPFRLACSATPAPNDIAELANHCEFLGVMKRTEMLSTFFVHDETGWRLKGHAHASFYRWLSSWGMFLVRPSDLLFSDDGYELPPLEIRDLVIDTGGPVGEYLFPEMGVGGLRGQLAARRDSIKPRADALLELVERAPGQWVIWTGLNDEQDYVAQALDGDCVSVAGKDDEATKVERIGRFLRGDVRILVSKVRIAGYGLNLQRCHQTAFLGLSYSFEDYFQAIRRFWRFGQREPVMAWIVVSSAETEVVAAVRQKEREAETLAAALVEHMRDSEREEIGATTRQGDDYAPEMPMQLPEWLAS